MNIGDWVRRPYRYGKNPKWHHVESIVADAAITHCGERMEPWKQGLPLEISDGTVAANGPVCKKCGP